MQSDDTDRLAKAREFERKIWRAKWAIVLETVFRRLWIVAGVAGAFIAVSLAGLWPHLHDALHIALLAAFGLAFAAACLYTVWMRWPLREDAIRRIEKVSGIPHRPASSYEDTLTASASDPATKAIWRAHRERMAALLDRLKPGSPEPGTWRYDTYALRSLLPLLLAVLVAFNGSSAWTKLGSAFELQSAAKLAEARLDAWVTPPAYTSRPPLMLSDGATPLGKRERPASDEKALEVPEKSVVIVRASGLGSTPLALETSVPGSDKPARIDIDPKSVTGDVQELRVEIKQSMTVKALAGSSELAAWRLDMAADNPPTIELSKKPELTPRGSLKLTYKAEDDYGIASARVKLEKRSAKAADPSRAWAAVERPSGPRPPLQRPPEMPLTITGTNPKKVEAHTYFDVASHPWAGLPVTMTLTAKDVAGKTGESQKMEMVLPERRFTKPLARAVVEQRRKLLDDPRWRPEVAKALAALTFAPEMFFDDSRIYLSLRTVYHRLSRERSRAAIRSSIAQLWSIALRIEDGNLSDAEKAVRDAQEKLSKALENGASEEEIAELMAELKQAMKNYMQELAKENQDGEQQNADGQDENNQTMSEQDLEKMLQDMEEMAKNGSREEAQKLLSEMRDLMERLQSGKMNEQQARQNKEMMETMNELSEMTGEQQKLMDETFDERRGDGEDKSFGKPKVGAMPGGAPERGQKGQGPQGREKGQRAQGGKTQRGQQGQQGQPGMNPDGSGPDQGQGQEGMGNLSERQRALRDRLEALQRKMAEKGQGTGEQLDAARRAMERAEQALKDGDLDEANEQQGEALEEMRENAQQMAQQMMKNSPQRYGQQGDSKRDPLGRPQKSTGPELGQSVKVPDQIDTQKAREILEELRRRLGEATRPPQELDYLERLLRRF